MLTYSDIATPEFRLGDFLMPWGMVTWTLGFLGALLILQILERFGWTRHIWHLPLFFVALAVLISCVIGLLFAP